jgi:hypothetical protein
MTSKKKTREQHECLAKLLPAVQNKAMTIKAAMLQAGYSEAQAAKGWSKVPQAALDLLPEKMQRLMRLGRTTPAQDMRALVHGRLIDNVTKGSDKGAQSAKILGSSRDLNMWTPDMQMGVVILQTPQAAIDRKAELLADDPDEVRKGD